MTEVDALTESVPQTMSDFLESTPPNHLAKISNLSSYEGQHGVMSNVIQLPEIQLHCPRESCNGVRFFRCVLGNSVTLSTKESNFFVGYVCSNCQRHRKTYSLTARVSADRGTVGEVTKFGELPPFGPPTPARLISLIGPDRDTFLKGRRCENQGLGIGAFIYYRRVVEHQKNRILQEIIKVSEKVGTTDAKLKILRDAKSESQFSKALDMAKNAIPESLLIDGHSPLLLLHGALSEGVHALSDEECLAMASSVRVVLGELSERLSQALKDEVELTKALSTLMSHRQK